MQTTAHGMRVQVLWCWCHFPGVPYRRNRVGVVPYPCWNVRERNKRMYEEGRERHARENFHIDLNAGRAFSSSESFGFSSRYVLARVCVCWGTHSLSHKHTELHTTVDRTGITPQTGRLHTSSTTKWSISIVLRARSPLLQPTAWTRLYVSVCVSPCCVPAGERASYAGNGAGWLFVGHQPCKASAEGRVQTVGPTAQPNPIVSPRKDSCFFN